MFFLCWEKDGQRGWEQCYRTKEIADVYVKEDLEKADKVFCAAGGYNAIAMSYEDILAAVEGKLPIKGSIVSTPRFLSVMLSDVFPSCEEAQVAGYREPTYYKSDYFEVLGKSLGNNCMAFAAALKPKKT